MGQVNAGVCCRRAPTRIEARLPNTSAFKEIVDFLVRHRLPPIRIDDANLASSLA